MVVDLRRKSSVGREPTVEDRARWVAFAEQIRQYPEILPAIKDQSPRAYARAVVGLRTLAIDARSDVWRSGGGRPEQFIPGTPGAALQVADWLVWLLMGGRGSGKSRTGAEATRELILGRRWKTEPPRWALVGQTLDAVRIDMVENTLLQVLPKGSVRRWNRGTCELWLSNGAYLKGYSSEAPRKLRGPNFHGAWADELATWKDADKSPAVDSTFSNLKLATRAEDGGTWKPRIVATTTPRPVTLLSNPDEADPMNPGPGVHDDESTVVTSMSTLANIENLPQHYIDTVVNRLIGTRLYDQEVLGLLVDAVIGAQWTHELIDRMIRPPHYPEAQGGGFRRITIAVDPSVGAGLGDECGIVVSALASDGCAYVLEDASKRCAPPEWVKIIDRMFRKYQAESVVAEVNHGFELVTETIGRYAPNLPVRPILAKRNKVIRAEPVALLSDQDRVRFAGSRDSFPDLIRQLTTFDGTGDSPDRLDAFVYSILDLLPVETGAGDLVSVGRTRGTR